MENLMTKPLTEHSPPGQFVELRHKAKKILNKLGQSHVDDQPFDGQRLAEELNIYHIELEIQNEELQKNRDQLETSQKYLDDLYAYAPVGYVVLDVDGKIQRVNKKASTYFQLSEKILKGQRLQSFIPHESLLPYNDCLNSLLDKNVPQSATVCFRIHGNRKFWARIDPFLIKNSTGPGDLILCSILDISRERAMEQELLGMNHRLEILVDERTVDLKEVNKALAQEVKERKLAEQEAKSYARKQKILLRELNHRVKNNMQIMVSLMNLQAKQVADPVALTALTESQNRIKALAMIHEILYMSENLSSIPFKQYLRKLCRHIAIAYNIDAQSIQIKEQANISNLHIDQAVPLGLVITELITNSIKHAFGDGGSGVVDVVVNPVEDSIIELCVNDNGVGFSRDMDSEKPGKLGLRLVHRIVEDQLSGSLTMKQNQGTEITVRFPCKQEEMQ